MDQCVYYTNPLGRLLLSRDFQETKKWMKLERSCSNLISFAYIYAQIGIPAPLDHPQIVSTFYQKRTIEVSLIMHVKLFQEEI
jgi:hypothetical protein